MAEEHAKLLRVHRGISPLTTTRTSTRTVPFKNAIASSINMQCQKFADDILTLDIKKNTELNIWYDIDYACSSWYSGLNKQLKKKTSDLSKQNCAVH